MWRCTSYPLHNCKKWHNFCDIELLTIQTRETEHVKQKTLLKLNGKMRASVFLWIEYGTKLKLPIICGLFSILYTANAMPHFLPGQSLWCFCNLQCSFQCAQYGTHTYLKQQPTSRDRGPHKNQMWSLCSCCILYYLQFSSLIALLFIPHGLCELIANHLQW